ncbi:MAG: hypothetical protein AAFX09_10890 [Pseudomonadota bacterium]
MSGLAAFVIWPGLGAVLTSLFVALLMMRAGVIDEPNARSNHASPTPRAGGLGVVAGLGAAGLIALSYPVAPAEAAVVIGFALMLGALGLIDDLFTPSSVLKFALITAACLIAAGLVGPVRALAFNAQIALPLAYPIALLGSGLFLFVVVNASNFMDGADAMLAAGLIPAGLGLVFAGLATGSLATSLAGAALAGGLFGFLLVNRPPARVFAGDVGSLCAGALYGAGALAFAGKGVPGSVWLAPLFVLPFLADVLLTMLRRARGGRLSLAAHREHAYQRLIASGWSHGQTALAYAGLSAACVLAGLIALQGPDWAPFAVFWSAVAVLSAVYAAASRIAQ